MQKILVLICEGSLNPTKLPDVSGPGLGEAGHYRKYIITELYLLKIIIFFSWAIIYVFLTLFISNSVFFMSCPVFL